MQVRIRRQTNDQANAGRMGPMASLQFGRDLDEAARNGSPQVQRRVKIFGRVMILLFVIVPATLLVLTEILN